MAYTDITILKRYLDISGATDDNLLGELIARAQSIIEAYTHRTFEAASNTSRYFDPTEDCDGPMLWLDRDLCAINSITNGDGTTVTSSQYVTEPRNDTPYYGIRIRSDADIDWTYSTYHENAITISGKWAYSTTAPYDIVQATVRLAAYLYRQKDNASDLDMGVISAGVPGGFMLPVDLPRDVSAMLSSYVRRVD